jgi:ATP-dependent protease ClpP protease subunit
MWEDSGMFRVTYTPSQAGRFAIYLFGAIESPEQFTEAVEAFRAASEGDIVEVFLQSPGGDVDATDLFLQAMHECEGRVIVRATGGCHSAASVILMHAPEFTLSPGFNCLIHNGSIGHGGKYSDWKSAGKFYTDFLEDDMRRTYRGFLTEDEIEEMIDGKDFWLDAPAFIERWKARAAYFGIEIPENFEGVLDTEEDEA